MTTLKANNKKSPTHLLIALPLVIYYLSLSSANAQTLPLEQVMLEDGKCLAAYASRYEKLQQHKAFAYAVNYATGAEFCGWAKNEKSAEAAKDSALAGCNERDIGATCFAVDVNHEWVAQVKDFTAIEPAPEELEYSDIEDRLESVERFVLAECSKLLKVYLEKPGHKAFAYAVDDSGQYACGESHQALLSKVAEANAIKGCVENKNEKDYTGTDPECRILAVNHDFFESAESYGFSKLLPEYKKHNSASGEPLRLEARSVLEEACHYQFRGFVEYRIPKAYYYAMDETGASVCGWADHAFDDEQAQAKAQKMCEHSRVESGVSSPCKLFALNDTIVATSSDFPLKEGVDGLSIAVKLRMIPRMLEYVEQGVEIDTQDSDGDTALLTAAELGDFEAYTYFLNAGANPAHENKSGRNLVAAAAFGEDVRIVRDALDKEISPNRQDNKGNTAMHLALIAYDRYTAHVLVSEGAILDIANNNGATPMSMLNKRKESLASLKENYTFWAAVKSQDLVGIEATYEALSEESQQRELVDAGFKVTEVSPSIYALLISKGLNPNARDQIGRGPLQYAVRYDEVEIAQLLLEAGADKSAENDDGKTPHDYVKSDRMRSLLE